MKHEKYFVDFTYVLFCHIIDTRLHALFAHNGSTVEFRKLKQRIISEIDEKDLSSLIQSLTGTHNTIFILFVLVAVFQK